ncbi:MAG: hypothetical protein LUF04_08410 [Bacteroides sp.]|nr:hypothetical protein [Bacteroides sp.]MCD8080418.1 hypothetical protein [Bacteroides sp.]
MELRKIFLFTGLVFFGIASLVWLAGWHPALFGVLLCAGVSMKVAFLFCTFRRPDFKMSVPMYMILTGVGLILVSLLFKSVIPMPMVQAILFYTAITLKVAGVALLFYPSRK